MPIDTVRSWKLCSYSRDYFRIVKYTQIVKNTLGSYNIHSDWRFFLRVCLWTMPYPQGVMHIYIYIYIYIWACALYMFSLVGGLCLVGCCMVYNFPYSGSLHLIYPLYEDPYGYILHGLCTQHLCARCNTTWYSIFCASGFGQYSSIVAFMCLCYSI